MEGAAASRLCPQPLCPGVWVAVEGEPTSLPVPQRWALGSACSEGCSRRPWGLARGLACPKKVALSFSSARCALSLTLPPEL